MVEALRSNDVGSIQQMISVMEAGVSGLLRMVMMLMSQLSAAQKALNSVLRQTQLLEELFNDDKTTVEEYQAFYNKLIASFIAEEVDEVVERKQGGKQMLPGYV